jgi:hypothetical protein
LASKRQSYNAATSVAKQNKKQAAAIRLIRKWVREALQFYSVFANHGALP